MLIMISDGVSAFKGLPLQTDLQMQCTETVYALDFENFRYNFIMHVYLVFYCLFLFFIFDRFSSKERLNSSHFYKMHSALVMSVFG